MQIKKLSDSQESEVCNLYLSGKSQRQIAVLYTVSKPVIRRILQLHNIESRSNKGTTRARPHGLKYIIQKENPTWFQKAVPSHNAGVAWDANTRQRISQSILKRFAEDPDYKTRIGAATKEAMARFSPEIREKLRFWAGKSMSEESIEKRTGPNHPNWRGGFAPYPSKFNKTLKAKIKTRDNYICQLCGISEAESLINFGRRLAVNHIDFDKQNCSEANLNTLCTACNAKINYNRDFWTVYFKEQQLCRTAAS